MKPFIWAVLAGLLATPGVAQDLESILSSDGVTRAETCRDVAGPLDNGGVYDLTRASWLDLAPEHGGHASCAMAAEGNEILGFSGGSFIPVYFFMRLADGTPATMEALVTPVGGGVAELETVLSIQNLETGDTMRLFSDSEIGPFLGGDSIVADLDLDRVEARGLVRALVGQGSFDLSPIGVSLGARGGPAACGDGGDCPEISCRREPVPGTLLPMIMFPPDEKELICDRLSLYEGRPHGEGPPDSRVARELIIRAVQAANPEIVTRVAPWSTEVVVEHSLSGVRWASDFIAAPVVRIAIRDVSLRGCQRDPASAMRCAAAVEIEQFSTVPTMPESVQRDLLEGMMSSAVRTEEVTLGFRRDGPRWRLALNEETADQLFATPSEIAQSVE